MADLIYPNSLPGPSTWRQRAVDRRSLRNLREPPNANRVGWRDRGINAEASWVYSAGEVAAWKAWFEGPLAAQAARLRWFSAVLPGRGGLEARVARYMAPPSRDYLGAGLWRVSAPLYVRGAGVASQQAATVAGGVDSIELREDGSTELREDNSNELRG